MSEAKHKEPLVAVLLSFVFTGLGQIYAGRVRRALILIGINIVIPFVLIPYILHPDTKFSLWHLLLILPVIGCTLFIPIDAYKSAKAWNAEHNLERKITTGKKTFLIFSIFALYLFSPMQLVALPITYYIRANVAQAFKIPSGAMRPTLMEGDKLFVDKAIYRTSEPQRGDIIVFDYPVDPKKSFIKRLVGLPGEKVEIKDGHVVINGVVQTQGSLGKFFYYNHAPYGENGQAITVPPDSYFVLGDNSANSTDSRFWGFVPKKNLKGKAYKIWWPLNRAGRLE